MGKVNNLTGAIWGEKSDLLTDGGNETCFGSIINGIQNLATLNEETVLQNKRLKTDELTDSTDLIVEMEQSEGYPSENKD